MAKSSAPFPVEKATTAELVAKYNELSGKPPIKKFSSRGAGEKQVAKLLAAAAPPKAKKAPRAPVASADRSEAIRASWSNKAVHDARSERRGVEVDGKYFRSVRAAFDEFKIPLGSHIKFRMDLKAAGEVKLEHGGKKLVFVDVPFRAKGAAE